MIYHLGGFLLGISLGVIIFGTKIIIDELKKRKEKKKKDDE